MCEVVRSPAERERLRAAGLARAAPFTWDRTARAVDALLSERVACAARLNTASERAETSSLPRRRRSPDQANELREPSRESHVYQMTRWILSRLRAFTSSDSARFSRDAWPRSVVTNPGAPLVLPFDGRPGELGQPHGLAPVTEAAHLARGRTRSA